MTKIESIKSEIDAQKEIIEKAKIQISMLNEQLQELKDEVRLEKLRIAQEYYDRIAAKTKSKIAARKAAI